MTKQEKLEKITDREKNGALIDILARVIDCVDLGVDYSKLSKLNLKKLDYSYRTRAEKDSEYKVVDRGFLGLLKSKIGAPVDSGDSVVNCFIYGKRNMGFYIDNNILYANQILKACSDFLVLMYNVIESRGVVFGGWVDYLPTSATTTTSGGDLDSCLESVKSVDDLAAGVVLF